MHAVILVIHLILALSIIALVLLQRSEGGGLGIGGGAGGLATPQATANIMTRATGICAGLFFTTSLLLGIMAGGHSKSVNLLDALDDAPAAIISETPQEEAPVVPIAE